MSNRKIRLGMLGMGTVGGSLAELIEVERAAIAARTGFELTITRASVRDLSKPRPVDAAILSTDSMAVATADDVDIIVELMGGIDGTRELVLAALQAGKHVVTGNKALLAAHGAELFAAASASNVELLFEASVAGGIPLMGALERSLQGEPIARVMGILNGTTNYILSQMTELGADYGDALGEAQELGYAEADPTADVEGHDAAAKAAIIATVSFRANVTSNDVPVEGISQITASDIATATRLGFVIKLLAVIERMVDGDEVEIAARVHPVMVEKTHPLASVRDSFNAVFIEGGAVGELMLYGRGAGGFPTASAVLGDVLAAANSVVSEAPSVMQRVPLADLRIRPLAELRSAFYMEVDVMDRPGVLATVAGVFGANAVSIRSMEQHGLGDEARLVFITHEALESDVEATRSKLADLDIVRQVGSQFRVIAS